MICSFMDSRGMASVPIKRCLFIGYIINGISLSDMITLDQLGTFFSIVIKLPVIILSHGKIK